MYYVYKLTFPNNKNYIGITNNFENRMRQHSQTSNHQPKLKRSILKYFWKNVKKEILIICNSIKIQCIYESLYIKEYDSISNGYNCTTGGEYTQMSEEIRQKHREYNAHPEVKERKSRELKERIKNDPRLNPASREFSKETRKKLSDNSKKRMEKDSDFYKIAISSLKSNEEQRINSIRSPEAKAKKKATFEKKRELKIEGNHSWKVKVFDPTSNITYPSIKRCSLELNKTKKIISGMIKRGELIRL